ncbi:hypothetical protein JX266_001329 [Neoarthrinium moseri]|nr:hypothetical protein JX266_001329 [Neoarthrinium moseri]
MFGEDPFDDDYFCDGNVVPWCQNDTNQQVTMSMTDAFKPKHLDPKDLFDVKTVLQADVLLCDGWSDYETDAISLDEPVESHKQRNTGMFPILHLPLEIRLEIYGWVYREHPVKQTQLMPSYPVPRYDSYFLKVVRPEPAASEEYCGGVDVEPKEHIISTEVSQGAVVPLLSPHRPFAGVPSALLRANKQIYHEIRELPLATNEFVFVNWFTSGLWAARSFIKGLRPWQRDAMRYARLELLARDLSASYAVEWQELCAFWARGLHGLRLKILGSNSGGGDSSKQRSTIPGKVTVVPEARDGDGELQPWVQDGLRSMSKLRRLEVELVAPDWDYARKIAWCAGLEEALNENPEAAARIRVMCVERDATKQA